MISQSRQSSLISAVVSYSEATKVRKFMRRNPATFASSKVEEDPYRFIHEMEKILYVMHAFDFEGVEFVAL